MSQKPPDKILIRMPNWLGDAVMAFDVIGGIKLLHPEATIDVAIRKPFAGLMNILPQVRKTFPLSGSEHDKSLTAIKTERYDLAFILPNSFRSAWELYGKDIHRRAGYAGNLRSFMLTETAPRPQKHSTHQADYFARLAAFALPQFTRKTPQVAIPDEAETKASKLLADISGSIVGVGFGATYGSAKMWPAERFAKLIDRLQKEQGSSVILLGGDGDREVEGKVMKECSSLPISLVGKTDLPTLAALLQRLKIYVTNDTGPMHLAAFLETPVVAIFGPTSPDETKPLADNAKVIYHGADCAPCWQRKCPIDHRCMTGINVDEVYDKVAQIVA